MPGYAAPIVWLPTANCDARGMHSPTPLVSSAGVHTVTPPLVTVTVPSDTGAPSAAFTVTVIFSVFSRPKVKVVFEKVSVAVVARAVGAEAWLVAAPGIATGLEALDAAPTPAEFVAATVNVYDVPPERPVIVQLVAPVVAHACEALPTAVAM
jgi:hypothetical protein